MRRRAAEPGSMDMLLDTMCNTFGGVCFIALMIAIISAALPKSEDSDSSPEVTAARLADKETARLRQRRDMLHAAIGAQSEFVENASTDVVVKADLTKVAAEVAASEGKLRSYEKKRVEYLDELARVKTSSAYSRREAERLAKLLAELEEKVGRPLFDRHRAVRTPKEREIPGLHTIDVWIHKGRLYMMDDNRSVVEENRREQRGRIMWDRRIVKGKGVPVDKAFFRKGGVWRDLSRRLDSDSYVRIFVDSSSFDELCLLRDALIDRRSMYNWILNEEDVIHFVEGYDGHVQ